MAFQYEAVVSRVCVPDPNSVVIRAGGQKTTVGRPRHAIQPTCMTFQSADFSTRTEAREERLRGCRGGIPNPDGFVIGAGGQFATVRRPRHALHPICMTFQ